MEDTQYIFIDETIGIYELLNIKKSQSVLSFSYGIFYTNEFLLRFLCFGILTLGQYLQSTLENSRII